VSFWIFSISIDFSFDFPCSFISSKFRRYASFIFFHEFHYTWELDDSQIFNSISCLEAKMAFILAYAMCIEVCSVVWSWLISAISLRTRLIWNSSTDIAFRWRNWVSNLKLKGITFVFQYVTIEIGIMKLAECISNIESE
jgi:hypothetical protein